MKILIIGPRHTLHDLQSYYVSPTADDIYYESEENLLASDLQVSAETLIEQGYDGFIGIVDWSSLFAAYLNQRIGASAPLPELVACLQDKLKSRQLQAKYVDFRGLAASPDDVSVEDFPLFMKPRHATMSFLAQEVPDIASARRIVDAEHAGLTKRNNTQWGQLYDLLGLSRQSLGEFVLETSLPKGIQVTLDGYVQNGIVGFFCFTRSYFYPNQVSFKRFDLPYKMDTSIELKITRHAQKFIESSGFDNTLFNIEYKIDLESGRFGLIEINTRPSSQFMYPIQCISGVHPIDKAINIVLGRQETVNKRVSKSRQASICILRRDDDAVVMKLPKNTEMTWLYELHPQSRWNAYAQPGERLSDYPGDSHSYRYAELTILDSIDRSIENRDDHFKAKFDALIEFE